MELKMKNLFVFCLILVVGCSSTTVSNLDYRLRGAYLAKISECFAKNHTLLNESEVDNFLIGHGSSVIQKLVFQKNRTMDSFGINASLATFSLGMNSKFNGISTKAVFLGRKKDENNNWLFKVGKGRWYIGQWMSDCEKMRVKWVKVDNDLYFALN